MIVAFSEIFLTKPSSRKVCRKVGYSIEVMQTVTGLGRWNRETERGGTDPRVFSIGPQRVRCTRVSASFQVTGGGPSLTTQIRDYADFLPGVKRRRQMVCVCAWVHQKLLASLKYRPEGVKLTESKLPFAATFPDEFSPSDVFMSVPCYAVKPSIKETTTAN